MARLDPQNMPTPPESAPQTGAAVQPPGWRALRSWVPVRVLGERHRPRVLAHLLALQPQDRLLRFGHVATDERVSHYAQSLDFDSDIVFGVFDRSLRLAALVHLAFGATDPAAAGSAELGISVLPHLRGRGVGALLLEHAITLARNRGVHALLINLARDNAPMLAIARKAGARVRFEGSDAQATLTLPDESLASQVHELFEQRAAELDYRLKLQGRRAPPP